MKQYSSVLFGLLATASALTSPIDNGGSHEPSVAQNNNGFFIDQVPADGSGPSGPQALAQMYEKYGIPAPAPVVKAAAAATQSGSVQATNPPGAEYFVAPVKIQGKTFKLMFDTATADLWVFSTRQPKDQQSKHVLYNAHAAPIANETWSVYGSTGASGVVYGDSCTVGPVTATTQAIEAATSVGSTFVGALLDGELGLGAIAGNGCSPYQCYTFMDQVGPTLPKNLFTAALRKGKPGRYTFGYIDKSLYKGDIAYSDVNTTATNNPALWEFIASGHSIGNGAKTGGELSLVVDSATTISGMPPNVVAAYYKKVSGAQYNTDYAAYIFPCKSALPSLSFYSGGGKHTVPGNYFNYEALASPSGYCYGGLQSNGGATYSVLGANFLKSQFVVFDVTNNRVGFAKQS